MPSIFRIMSNIGDARLKAESLIGGLEMITMALAGMMTIPTAMDDLAAAPNGDSYGGACSRDVVHVRVAYANGTAPSVSKHIQRGKQAVAPPPPHPTHARTRV